MGNERRFEISATFEATVYIFTCRILCSVYSLCNHCPCQMLFLPCTVGGVSVAWLMEQVILRLGYGIDEGLFPAEVTLWRFFFPTPPLPTKAETKEARRTSAIASKLIEHNCYI